METVGIKETKEMINMLGELAFTAGVVMKDGKVNAADLTALPGLVTKFPIFEAGVADIDKTLEEMKNLDQMEVMELIGAIYAAVNRFSEGKK
jgi:hypothetical protein